MRKCPHCHIFAVSGILCIHCGSALEDVSMEQALEHTRKRFIRRYIQGKNTRHVDRHMQYIFASYFSDTSIAMLYTINKNLLKLGREYERFLVRPFHISDVFNIPWLIYNVVDSNIFHMRYQFYCPRCDCKHVKGRHSEEECQYNQMFLNILKDALSGEIVQTKKIYQAKADEDRYQHRKNAYIDLSASPKILHLVVDFSSVSVSVLAWLALAVYLLLPVIIFLLKKADLYNALTL